MRENKTSAEPHQKVAAEVRAEMARQRMSQHELARRLGVTQTTISRRHTGEVPWDVSELLAVAEVLKVPVTYFFDAAERGAR